MKTQLCVAYRLSPQLKVLIREKKPEEILMTSFEGKEFLGKCMDVLHPTVKDVQKVSEELLFQLEEAFPSYHFNPTLFVVFPLLFIG